VDEESNPPKIGGANMQFGSYCMVRFDDGVVFQLNDSAMKVIREAAEAKQKFCVCKDTEDYNVLVFLDKIIAVSLATPDKRLRQIERDILFRKLQVELGEYGEQVQSRQRMN
jgi:hypothetical protein